MQGWHLVDHTKNKGLLTNNVLHVVSVVSNPVRYQSRFRLYRYFVNHMQKIPHAIHYTVECAFGDRAFEMTDSTNPLHLQLRTSQELWLKENMINLGVKHLLPKDWKYLAWVDADIQFANVNWAQEAMHQLQHFPVIQPWSECTDLGFHGNILQLFESFCSIHRKHIPKQRNPGEPYKYAHSGFAWACTRFFWENVGGLMDFPILGSSDHHMAWALSGRVDETVHGKMGPEFHRRCAEWQERACKVTQGDHMGYVKGRIEHFFHGPKAKRKYRERWQILYENGFNPDKDLSYDSQGLLHLTQSKPKLIADLRDYFNGRHEDEISDY